MLEMTSMLSLDVNLIIFPYESLRCSHVIFICEILILTVSNEIYLMMSSIIWLVMTGSRSYVIGTNKICIWMNELNVIVMYNSSSFRKKYV